MDYPHLERLSAVECRRLLPVAPLGRLVVATPTFPTLDPVSFAMVEGELVVAVRPGSAGDALPAGSPVAFEVDVLDEEQHRGWSVVAKGEVEDLDAEVAALVRPALRPWAVAPGDRLLLIRSAQLTGQRIVSGPPAAGDDERPAASTAAGAGAPVVARRALGADAALALLRQSGAPVGRLAIVLGGEPLVFPLNFSLDGDAVVFRTQVGTKLSGITRSMATFEVDRVDASGQGWSVTFEGLAQEVIDADPASLRARIEALALETWPGGIRPHVVRITPYGVRGTAWTAADVAVAGATTLAIA